MRETAGGEAADSAAPRSRCVRVQLLPDVIDLSLIPTGSGILSLAFVLYGAVRRFDPERIGRLALLGTLLGGLITAGFVLAAVLLDVVS
jgi:hypothetical protein